MEAAEKEQKSYELSFLGKEENVAGEVVNLLWRFGAEMLLEGPVEKIALAYPVKNETSAFFGYFHFRANPARVPDLDRELKTAPAVLRHLIVTPPIEKGKPKWGKVIKTKAFAEAAPQEMREERRPAEQPPLSNEELEKKIEEILQ